MESAHESALEDWKIDIEREGESKKEPYLIEFERLSEFFFDLCLSWCHHLELELFLYFVNGIFLNITRGAHVNVSEFKPVEEVEVLSIEFFNQLLQYRGRFDREAGMEGYQQWYTRNFGRQIEIVRNVERNLQDAFKGKEDSRILDLWLDMPASNPALQGGYLQQNFEKLEKDFITMHKATKAQGTLIHSMNMMDAS